jgi:hypothetical protein
MDLLSIAKAERARLDRVIALLESGAEKPTASAAPRKPKSRASPASKAYWTPQRRAEMSRRIKALNAKKKKA